MKRLLSIKKFEIFFLHNFSYILEYLLLYRFLCLVELSFWDLDCLYIVAAIPHRRRIGGEGGDWVGDQVLWKLSEVVVQVAGLVTVRGGSWGGEWSF